MKTWLCLWLLLWPAAVPAHKPSDSYLSLDAREDRVAGRWDIALRDLDYALGLDADDDGALTWGEVRRREAELAAYALARLGISRGGRNCPLQAEGLLVDEHTDGKYAVLPFQALCAGPVAALELDYRLFSELDPQHRGLVRLGGGGGIRTAVLAPGEGPRRFELGGASNGAAALPDFLREGVWHIWIGYDHLLFLLSLLLPAVLVREAAGWRRAESFRAALWDVVKVVTAFTLAHSVTLGLASLGYVDLPSRWVESAIAASVIAAALNNLLPVFHGRRPHLAFGFGLVHGLGFASVLSDLALPDSARLWGLLGFNLGVEAGQLAMVGVFLPLAYGLGHHRLYRTAVLKAGSAAIALLAGAWFLERAFDWKLAAWIG